MQWTGTDNALRYYSVSGSFFWKETLKPIKKLVLSENTMDNTVFESISDVMAQLADVLRDLLLREDSLKKEEAALQKKREALSRDRAAYDTLAASYATLKSESGGDVRPDLSHQMLKDAVRKVITIIGPQFVELTSVDVVQYIDRLPEHLRPKYDMVVNRANIAGFLNDFVKEGILTLHRPGSGRRPAVYRLATSTKEGG